MHYSAAGFRCSSFEKALSITASRSTSTRISSSTLRFVKANSSAPARDGSILLHSSSLILLRQPLPALAAFFQSSRFSTV